jgi:hypothetical protein
MSHELLVIFEHGYWEDAGFPALFEHQAILPLTLSGGSFPGLE